MRDASKRSLVYRINRNILECKENNIFVTFIFCHVLIETYWNVKFFSKKVVYRLNGVLIETYWNVKSR